jgi:hypothetical protein
MYDALRPIPPPEDPDAFWFGGPPSSPLDELRSFLTIAHNPDLLGECYVYQVWEDGEITLQKGGLLLWAKSLKVVRTPLPFVTIPMPVPCSGGHSYAVVTKGDAHHIRDLMCRVAGQSDPFCASEEPAAHPVSMSAVAERLLSASRRKAARDGNPL